MTVESNEKVALAFIATLMDGAPDGSLYEPSATGWHNFDAGPGPIEDGFKSMSFIRQFVPDFRFDEMRVHPSERSCTLQYVIRGSLPDGATIEAPAVIVLTFSPEGRIASLEEYLDTAQVRSLSDLMATALERRAVDRPA